MRCVLTVMLAFALAGDAWAALDAKLDNSGVLKIEDLTFEVVHKDEKWAPAFQRDLKPELGYPRIALDSHEVRGLLNTGAGRYMFSQILKRADENSSSYYARIIGTPTQATRQLGIELTLPAETYRGQRVFIDQKACVLPWWCHEEMLSDGKIAMESHAVRIPLKHGGTLVIEGRLAVSLIDMRAWGNESYCVRLSFSPCTGMIDDASVALTLRRVSAAAQFVPYDANVAKPKREKAVAAAPQRWVPDRGRIAASLADVKPILPVRPQRDEFVDSNGQPTRFWGMNLCAFYPDYDLAEKTAANLASLGVNLVRHQHLLRPSADWAPEDCSSLMTFHDDSRTPNRKAWDRFDYLNARLRQKRIYLSLSVHSWRSYLPADVAILRVSAEDDEAWGDAMEELTHWQWQKQLDPCNMLAVFDERCFLIDVEFAKMLLTHVNPYTGLAYGKDPQVLTLELINEFSSEYTILCKNVFPAYWTKKLERLLADYAKAHGVQPFGLYQARTQPQLKCLSEFCNSLDEAYARRMRKTIRELGYQGPIELQNLWRGDANLRVRSKTDDFIEDHAYDDPLAINDPDNFGYSLAKSAIVNKPLIIGEFNHSENPSLIAERRPVRAMLSVAAAAYGSLQNWSGVTWFAWTHGVRNVGPDGWGAHSSREIQIGVIAGDGVVLDHLRTAGIVFKNRYLRSSVQPQVIYVDDSYFPPGYAALVDGQCPCQPGWQAVHRFCKAFAPIPAQQKEAPWFKAPPGNPAVSDTGQIVHDSRRKQLSFAAPKAEGLSGYLDGKTMGKLSVVGVVGNSGFATMIAVTLDDAPLVESRKILLSRTYSDAEGSESPALQVTLRGLTARSWTMKVTRPAFPQTPPQTLSAGPERVLMLPATAWNECELEAR